MTFDWNLDRQADEDSTQDYLGFEPFGLTQDPAAPVDSPVLPTWPSSWVTVTAWPTTTRIEPSSMWP